MTTALTNSVNTWLGPGRREARHGHDVQVHGPLTASTPSLRSTTPSFQLATSGVFDGSNLLDAGDPIDIGRMAIGQERLRVTPLQMAEVAATVANQGELMEPRLWSKVIDPTGGRRSSTPPARAA